MRFVLFLLSFASACLMPNENGFVIFEGHDVYPTCVPLRVNCSLAYDCSDVGRAMSFWNTQLGFDVFAEGHNFEQHVADVVIQESDVLKTAKSHSVDTQFVTMDSFVDVFVADGDVEYPALATANVHIINGSIHRTYITLDEDRPESMSDFIIRHELGHALGLDDDPYSVDKKSVMSNVEVYGYKVTDEDKELISSINSCF